MYCKGSIINPHIIYATIPGTIAIRISAYAAQRQSQPHPHLSEELSRFHASGLLLCTLGKRLEGIPTPLHTGVTREFQHIEAHSVREDRNHAEPYVEGVAEDDHRRAGKPRRRAGQL